MYDKSDKSIDYFTCGEVVVKDWCKFLILKKDKKQAFKLELPRLEGIEGNMLKIVPGGVEKILNKSLR